MLTRATNPRCITILRQRGRCSTIPKTAENSNAFIALPQQDEAD